MKQKNYCTAQIAHLLVAVNRETKSEPPELTDFMPFFNRNDEQETEDDGVAEYLVKR